MAATAAIRARVTAEQPLGGALREDVAERAAALGVLGWVRAADDGGLQVHAEGDAASVDALAAFLSEDGRTVDVERVRREGHEQFAIRGVPAGVFVVQQHAATARHFDLRLEVGGVMRSWAVPKGPSLDPAVKRLAVEVEDHSMGHNDFEGRLGEGGVIVWDRGGYEQGGRVPWPEALDRGHAVFVLHGEKLRGGFALQRTRPGEKAQWLLVKRRDDDARPGSDIAAEAPGSVVSGRTLDEVLRG
ncbi:acylphosphatase [Capillimicrobium parvum]|nr:DNA polymerase ligase N-terminal domain-containing protein [Capillimicrobium parvum]